MLLGLAAAAEAVEPRARQTERKLMSCILKFFCWFGDGALGDYRYVLDECKGAIEELQEVLMSRQGDVEQSRLVISGGRSELMCNAAELRFC